MKKIALYGFVFAGFLTSANAAENSVPTMYWDSNEVITPMTTNDQAVWREVEDEVVQKPGANEAKFDGDLGW